MKIISKSKILSGEIQVGMCVECGDKYRKDGMEAYDGTYTIRVGSCALCKQEKEIMSSLKLLGFYKGIC